MDGDVVQFEPNRIVYRVSALGGCIKMLVAARMGYDAMKPPAKTQELFDRGHVAEERAIEVLRFKRLIVVNRQKTVEIPITDGVVLRGHIDGENQELTCGVEIKSQNQEEWDRFEKHGWEAEFFPKYKWQISAYIHALGLPFYLVRYNRETADVDIQFVSEPFYTLDEIRARIMSVEDLVATGELPVACIPAVQYPCPYYYLHEELDRDYIDDPAIDEMARKYDNLGKLEKTVKQIRKDIKESLRGLAGSTMKLKTATGTKVTFFTTTRVNRIMGMNDPDDPFKLEQEIDQVRVTVKEAKDKNAAPAE